MVTVCLAGQVKLEVSTVKNKGWWNSLSLPTKINECTVFANFELICWLTAAKDTVAMSTFLRVIVKMRQCSGRVYLEVNRQNFQELVDLKYFLNYNWCNNHYLSHMTHVVSVFKPSTPSYWKWSNSTAICSNWTEITQLETSQIYI